MQSFQPTEVVHVERPSLRSQRQNKLYKTLNRHQKNSYDKPYPSPAYSPNTLGRSIPGKISKQAQLDAGCVYSPRPGKASVRQVSIYQSQPLSPSKPAPYRGGRKKEEPPPCMSAEEKRRWEKERIKKDNHNKSECVWFE